MRRAGLSLNGRGLPARVVDPAVQEVPAVREAQAVDLACVPEWVWARVPVWRQAHGGPCIRRVPSPVVRADPEALVDLAAVLALGHVPASVHALAWADALAWVGLAPA